MKTVKRIKSKDAQLIKRQTWTAPDATVTDNILNGQLVTATSLTFTTFAAQPDFARILTLIAKTNATDVPAGDVVITGTDIDDNVITDSLTFAANLGTAVNSVKAFKTVTKIVFPTPDGNTATWDLGMNDQLGLSEPLQEDSLIMSLVDGTVEGTRSTIVVKSTDKTQNTIDTDTAYDGAKDVVAFYFYPWI